jgi:hypothetical protein
VPLPFLMCLLCACTSANRHQPALTLQQPDQIMQACGKPLRVPVSPECIALSPNGKLLSQASKLQMAVWRACPSQDPCLRVELPAACKGGNDPTSENCKKAVNEADSKNYACHAFQTDPLNVQQRQAWSQCARTKCAESMSKARYRQKHHRRSGKKAWNALVACLDACGPSPISPTREGASDDNFPQCVQAKRNWSDFQHRTADGVIGAELRNSGLSR